MRGRIRDAVTVLTPGIFGNWAPLAISRAMVVLIASAPVPGPNALHRTCDDEACAIARTVIARVSDYPMLSTAFRIR